MIYPAVYSDHTPASPFPSVRENGTGYLLTSKRVEEYLQLYRSKPEDLQNPYLAPLLAGDFSGQPDTLVITAEYDPLRDEGEEYARRLPSQETAWFCIGCPTRCTAFFRCRRGLHRFAERTSISNNLSPEMICFE